MKWVLANQSSASMKKYQLTEGDAIKLEVKYNLQQQSVRISSEESHRLFFIAKTGGLWNNKTILKNEYGVEIGRISFDKVHHTGNIEVEGKKYHYTIQQKGQPQLVMFEHNSSIPMVVCDLSMGPAVSSLQLNTYSSEECACFLLGLCWYQFPVTAAEKMEYVIV